MVFEKTISVNATPTRCGFESPPIPPPSSSGEIPLCETNPRSLLFSIEPTYADQWPAPT